MAIRFYVDQESRWVRTICTGVVTLRDFELYAAALAERGLLRRPQLVDARRALLAFRPGELEWLSDLMAALRHVYGRAPVAFVTQDRLSQEVAQRYRALGAGGNPDYRVFADPSSAGEWILTMWNEGETT
jgi:hypothetical protein